MSKYTEKARQYRSGELGHYNCAQAVLCAFALEAGLDEQTAYKLTAEFGGGMNRQATCGAVSGGLMTIGLFGLNTVTDSVTFYNKFKERHDGLLECADLRKLMKERGQQMKEHCDGCIYDSIEIVEEMLKERRLIDA